jgi:hypothetical protein
MFSWADETKHTAMQFITIKLQTQEEDRTKEMYRRVATDRLVVNTMQRFSSLNGKNSIADCHQHEPLNQEDLNKITDTYAIVATNNEVYCGHVYVWLSPVNNKVCLMTNPICPIERQPTEERLAEVNFIREELVKQCIQFYNDNCCDLICLLDANPTNKDILENIGFKKDTAPIQYFQESILLPERTDTNKCVAVTAL